MSHFTPGRHCAASDSVLPPRFSEGEEARLLSLTPFRPLSLIARLWEKKNGEGERGGSRRKAHPLRCNARHQTRAGFVTVVGIASDTRNFCFLLPALRKVVFVGLPNVDPACLFLPLPQKLPCRDVMVEVVRGIEEVVITDKL